MSNLRAIVYVSTAERMFAETELEALLVEARDLNLETGITGVLLYSGGTFMQCFEGTTAAVDATYERINKSTRHHGIIELVDEPIVERDFADWQMGYQRVKHSELLALSSARWGQRLAVGNEHAAPGSHGMTLLKHFWERTPR
jgi:hypothetical protein